ncbi:MAG: cyclic nucleotide-binding domain-containing protein [Spirochaetaceae bacterium]
MTAVYELLRSVWALPSHSWLIPVGVLFVYLAVTRSIRNRTEAAWVPTVVLLADVVVVPLFFVALDIVIGAAGGALAETVIVTRAIWAVFFVAVAWLTVRLLRRFLWQRHFVRTYGREAPRILQHIVAIGLYFVAFAVILVAVFERQAGSVLVSTSVLVGVVGLALQNVLSDLFSGISLTLERPFTVGDWVRFADGTEGEVTDISWQAIYLKSFNESRYVLPNRTASSIAVHNYSKPTRIYAQWFEVHVDARHDPVTVRQLLLEAALGCAAVRKAPSPVVNIADASGNPYVYIVYVRFKDFPAHFSGRTDLYLNIHTYLTRAGIGTASVKYEVATEDLPERKLEVPSVEEELRRLDLFSILDDEQVMRVAESAVPRTFYPEDVMVEEGTKGSSLFIVTSGAVQVSKRSPKKTDVEMTRLGAGDVIGEMSLLTGEPRTATVTALVPVTAIEVTKEALAPILREVPELSDKFAEVMLDRRLENEDFLKTMRRSDQAASDFVSDYIERIVRRTRRFFRL